MKIEHLDFAGLERCSQRFADYSNRKSSPAALALWGARVVPLMGPREVKGRFAHVPLSSPTRAAVGYLEYAPGAASLPYRNPDAIENILCLEGPLEVSWGMNLEHSTTLGRFDMLSMPADVQHVVRNKSERPARAIVALNGAPDCTYRAIFAEEARKSDVSPEAAAQLQASFGGRGRDAAAGEVENRITRFEKLVPYKKQLQSNTGIPTEATEWLTASSVFPLIIPEGHIGRSQYAPLKGLPGLYLAIAECVSGDGPLPHAHFDSQESFLVLDGEWDITSGPNDELRLPVKPYDLVAMPDKVMRSFRNTGKDKGRLFVIIQGQQKMSDLVAYSPEVGEEVKRRHGEETVAAFNRVNITFDAGVV